MHCRPAGGPPTETASSRDRALRLASGVRAPWRLRSTLAPLACQHPRRRAPNRDGIVGWRERDHVDPVLDIELAGGGKADCYGPDPMGNLREQRRTAREK
jgi:hypothetical protein